MMTPMQQIHALFAKDYPPKCKPLGKPSLNGRPRITGTLSPRY